MNKGRSNASSTLLDSHVLSSPVKCLDVDIHSIISWQALGDTEDRVVFACQHATRVLNISRQEANGTMSRLKDRDHYLFLKILGIPIPLRDTASWE